MTPGVTPEERAALLEGYARAFDDSYNAEIVAKVNAEAEAATALPWWWPEAAALVIIATIAISMAFPMGVA